MRAACGGSQHAAPGDSQKLEGGHPEAGKDHLEQSARQLAGAAQRTWQHRLLTLCARRTPLQGSRCRAAACSLAHHGRASQAALQGPGAQVAACASSTQMPPKTYMNPPSTNAPCALRATGRLPSVGPVRRPYLGGRLTARGRCRVGVFSIRIYRGVTGLRQIK